VREALPDASVLKLGMVHPLPMERIAAFAAQVDTLYIVEELEPIIENQVRAGGIACHGKDLLTRQGEYSVALIARALGGNVPETMAPAALPARPPIMCAGCPHRGVYYVLNKLKYNVSGDIGCYTLGALKPLETMDACICMGASIGMALGMEKARGKEFGQKTVAVIGDSTFIHSGITGLIDVVYNGGNTTVIILDNSTTGMTGHQEHPATGKSIKGEPAPQLNLEALCRAVGVADIQVLDPFDTKAVEAALKHSAAHDGPSVIIARRPCALLNRRNVRPALKVNPEKCVRCRMCMRLGCPALVGEGKDIRIDSAQCVGCDLCAGVCPRSAIEKEGQA
jgi:indolepyruvate ferredoxin oxidoreductase alpha subunit